MSDLPKILSRLVQEGLRGPIHRPEPSKNFNPAAVDKPKSLQQGIVEQDPDWDDPRWQLLFDEFFISDHLDDWHDDLLFFVQRGEVENGGKGADPVFVKRKVQGHKKILTPEQEQVVLWKDTFFLNVIVQLHCKLTVAVCTRVAETHPLTGATKTSMTCTRKHVSKRVYASPTKSRMDVKEESVECSWPIIYYVIDDFEDMFEHLMVHGQEYLCVELAVTLPNDHLHALSDRLGNAREPPSTTQGVGAAARPGARQSYTDQHDGPQAGKPFPTGSARSSGQGANSEGPILGGHGKITLFQGAANFQSLASIYQQKAAAKVAKRFKLGPRKVPQEFVMMRGPGGRGHAQVAITASDRLDDHSLLAAGAGLTSVSETHLGRYHQAATAAALSSSPPMSNSAFYSRPQAHQQRPHNSEKSLPSPPDSQHPQHIHPSTSPMHTPSALTPSAYVQQRWANGHQPSQAFTVRHKPQYPPPAPSSSFFASGNGHGHPQVSGETPGVANAAPKLSPTRSFSTGSFFNSLRKLSLATLAHATGNHQYRQPSPPPSPPPSISHDPTSYQQTSVNGSRQRLHSFPQGNAGGGPRTLTTEDGGEDDNDTDTANSVRSGISSHGTGSRQEIEALVRDPKSLKCCMTFVNVPWTAIATTLMDFAYQQYPTAARTHP